MKRVTISDAKNNLSRHLRYVRRGGRVRILDRDTPVADLVPVELRSDDEDARRLSALEKRGVLRRGKSGPLPKALFRPGPPDPRGVTVRMLLDERRGSR
ncbi:MAG TPA: type II toxin-antitoxin system prevent-host-death family antitoxin [Planctomycetota bacterium]|nr:type II toxin-antitoxin system prevent-host-death family antitoxin [Planctomycetota bacterium]